MSFMTEQMFELTPDILARINVGRAMQHVSLDQIPDSAPYKAPLVAYVSRVVECVNKGVGLLLWGDTRTGKCVVPGTFVIAGGRLRRIGKLAWPLGEVTPMRTLLYGSGGSAFSDAFVYSGIKPTIRCVLDSGAELTGTENHPVLIRRANGTEGFVQLVDVKEGDRVVVDLGAELDDGALVPLTEPVGRATEVTEEFAELYAWLLGEGHLALSQSACIHFTNADKTVVERVRHLFRSVLGRELYVPDKPNGNGCYECQLNDVEMTERLLKLGLGGRPRMKWVADEVLASPKRVLTSFLGPFFDAEASVGVRQGGVDISTASPFIASAVQQMLLALGVWSKLNTKMACAMNGTRIARKYSRLQVPTSFMGRLREAVGNRSVKLSRLSLGSEAKQFKVDALWGVAPLAMTLLAKCRGSKMLHGIEGRRLRNNLGSIATRNTCSREIAQRLMAALSATGWPELTELSRLLGRKVAYTCVCVVQRDLAQPVMDVSVPETHTFWSNGFVSHNTCAAAIVAKAAAAHGGKVYFTRADEMVHAILEREKFICGTIETTIEKRVLEVDLLVIDELNETTDARERRIIERVVRHRQDRLRATVITSNLQKANLRAVYGEPFLQSVEEHSVPLPVFGVNWHGMGKAKMDTFLRGEGAK